MIENNSKIYLLDKKAVSLEYLYSTFKKRQLINVLQHKRSQKINIQCEKLHKRWKTLKQQIEKEHYVNHD